MNKSRLLAGLMTMSVPWVVGCAHEARPEQVVKDPSRARISRDQAIAIAERDAIVAYPRLHDGRYDLKVGFDAGRWHVAWELKPGIVGGGPTYVIDAESGEILQKSYEQ